MVKKILFVCTGNTCRSSMAEAIAQKIINDNPEKMGDILVASAGTHAMEGVQASNHAIQITRDKGMDLNNFRAKAVNQALIKEADLILTMTNSHKQQILNLVPEAQGKVYLLKEFIQDYDTKLDHYKEAEQIYQRIQEKQQRFLAENKQTLEELENKKQALEEELNLVMTKIGELETKLYELTKKERQELASLERDIHGLEIIDPFGQPLEVYNQCYNELYEAINEALRKITE